MRSIASCYHRVLWLAVLCLTVVSCSSTPSSEPVAPKVDREPVGVSQGHVVAKEKEVDNLRGALECNASFEVVDRLLKDGVTVTSSNLLYAILSEQDPKVIGLLRRHGATLDRGDGDALTCKLGSISDAGLADPGYVRMLLDSGAGAHAEATYAVDLETGLLSVAAASGVTVDCQGTILHRAAGLGNLEVVKILLEHGADPKAQDSRGMKPRDLTDDQALMAMLNEHAVPSSDDVKLIEASRQGDLEAVKGLLAGGADINAEEPGEVLRYDTPLMVACRGHLDIVKLLLERRADTNPKIASDDGSPGVNVIYPPLTCGTRSNSLETVRMLLAKRARVDAKDFHGRIALTYAVNPDPSVCLPDDAFDVVSALVDGGADVNTQLVTKSDYDNGYTSLMLACRHRFPYHSLRTIEFLLDRGADIQMKNSKGQTALMIASDKSQDVVALIQSKSAD